MSFFAKKILLLTILLVYCSAQALIQELNNLKNNLTTLSDMLTKPKIVSMVTYEELENIVKRAKQENTSKPFDEYPQTIALKTAKYLFEELQNDKTNEKLKNSSNIDYIPFMGMLAEQISIKYKDIDKKQPFNCVSLASGELQNEFLLIRMLRYLGFTSITVIPLDIIYDMTEWSEKKNEIEKNFRTWCEEKNIPISIQYQIPLDMQKEAVNVLLMSNAYTYIANVLAGKLPKNHVLLMLQPASLVPVGLSQEDLRNFLIKRKIPTPNYMSLSNMNNKVEVYLPYDYSDSFISQQPSDKETIKKTTIKDISQLIKEIGAEEEAENSFYQPYALRRIIDEYYKSLNMKSGAIGVDIDLVFLDLIKHTALDSKNPLAFKTLYLKITQIIDMSGTMKIIFERYFKQ